NFARVSGHGIEVAQVGLGHLVSLALGALDSGDGAAVSAAPADDQQIALGRAINRQLGNVIGNVGNLLGAGFDHVLMVHGIVADVPGDVFFFQAADTVLQPRGSGNRPLAHEALIALVRQEVSLAVAVAVGNLGMRYFNPGQTGNLGNQPG